MKKILLLAIILMVTSNINAVTLLSRIMQAIALSGADSIITLQEIELAIAEIQSRKTHESVGPVYKDHRNYKKTHEKPRNLNNSNRTNMRKDGQFRTVRRAEMFLSKKSYH